MKTQRTKNMERLMDALNLCRKFHEDQTDKCGQPYWIHPFTVAMRGFTGHGSENEATYAIVGLLHDVPEDTSLSVEMLSELIYLTPEEKEALELLTHKGGITYDEYINSIIESGNEIAISVKMDDLLHNMRLTRLTEAGIAVTESDEKRTEKYSEYFYKLREKLIKIDEVKYA